MTMTPIFTQTVGAGGTSTLNFNNIPQTFTDLVLVASTRCNLASNNAVQGAIRFNNDTGSNYSDRNVYGTGSSAQSTSASTTFANLIVSTAATATSNTFANSAVCIPNYTANTFKSFSIDSVPETNGTTFTLAGTLLGAGLWRSTAAITSMSIFPGGGASFTEGSTFTLYGITKFS